MKRKAFDKLVHFEVLVLKTIPESANLLGITVCEEKNLLTQMMQFLKKVTRICLYLQVWPTFLYTCSRVRSNAVFPGYLTKGPHYETLQQWSAFYRVDAITN